ncbi:MAG: hypothetical protein OXE99_08720, partial [Cellvibrionales bacterium]|nr:hypothetical protein [Cellvibrionales bacterium]
MILITQLAKLLGILLIFTAINSFAGSATVEIYGEEDTSKYMGYSYKIETTSDRYCVSSTSPSDGILTPGTGVAFYIDFESGAFTYCGWRHSHQYFHVQQYDNPDVTAMIEWYKPAGKDPHINVTSDPHGIVHVSSRSLI